MTEKSMHINRILAVLLRTGSALSVVLMPGGTAGGGPGVFTGDYRGNGI